MHASLPARGTDHLDNLEPCPFVLGCHMHISNQQIPMLLQQQSLYDITIRVNPWCCPCSRFACATAKLVLCQQQQKDSSVLPVQQFHTFLQQDLRCASSNNMIFLCLHMQHIYMCDSKGLVTTSRGDELPAHKKIMARKDDTPNMKDLTEIVRHVKPHAVVGLTGGGEAWGKVWAPCRDTTLVQNTMFMTSTIGSAALQSTVHQKLAW